MTLAVSKNKLRAELAVKKKRNRKYEEKFYNHLSIRIFKIYLNNINSLLQERISGSIQEELHGF